MEEQFRVQGSDLPKGSAQSLDEAEDLAASAPAIFGTADRDNVDPVLFSETDFPNRPVTHGAPFGPGDNAVYSPRESERTVLNRIATRIVEQRGSVPETALVWAVRTLAGE